MQDKLNWDEKAPRVIAHRGASAYAPENTMSAFNLAVELEADAIELDVKLLKDGNIIVLHDRTLDRTTNGAGSVYRCTYQDLSELDAGASFAAEFSFEKIPTLDQVLEEHGGRIRMNIELTNYHRPWDRLPRECVKMVKRYQLADSILFSSFNPWTLLQVKKVAPDIKRALLLGAGTTPLLERLFRSMIESDVLHPQHTLLENVRTNRFVPRYSKINVWTVNERNRMLELMEMGVSGIITDYPDVALEVWDEFDHAMSSDGY